MQTYTIQINEEQRKILEEALKAIEPVAQRDGDEETSILLDMFIDLPEQEASQPEIIHGFCW